jgi:hypothetical protein
MGKNLVTRAEYKTYAGITSPNQDAEIDTLIPKVSELVKTYCRRTFIDFYDEAAVDRSSGGFEKIILKETPIVQILSVEKSTNYGQTYSSLVEFQDWVLDAEENTVVALSTAGFEKAINGYQVSYYGGYEYVPEDLKLAVFDLITYYRKNDGAIHSTKAPGTNAVQIEYISTTNLPAHIKRVLDFYVADYT